MNIRQMRETLRAMLKPAVGDSEAIAMALAIIEDVRRLKAIDIALYGNRTVEPETEKRMRDIARKVIDGAPLQYAIGSALFKGRRFSVAPGVLIPRPETAQLVDIIEKRWDRVPDLRVLDIGTGSGCIAISLAIDLLFPVVEAIDISPAALTIAAKNAQALKAKVRLMQADVLKPLPLNGPYNIIVSNPPYVMQSERPAMDPRVADYEPPEALFVPDTDPLLFYKPIAALAASTLAPGGMLYLEINPLCARQLAAMLAKAGLEDVEIVRDYRGAERFAIAKAPKR